MVTKSSNIPGSFSLLEPNSLKEADWIESLVRTMSRGYVNVTDVMPAKPPHIKRQLLAHVHRKVGAPYGGAASRWIEVLFVHRFIVEDTKGLLLVHVRRPNTHRDRI